MPIPARGERDDSQAGAALLEYIGRKRLHQVRERRQRRLIWTTVVLGALVSALAVSNVVLLTRLNAVSEAPRSTTAASPSVAARPAPVAPTTPEPAPPGMPQPAAPTTPEPAAPATTQPAAAATPEPPALAAQRLAAPTPPPPSAGPERGAVPPGPNALAPLSASAPPAAGRSASGAVVTAPTSPAAAEEEDSARRTARWLLRTHGLVEAENRVRMAAEFYSGEQSAFWRRVLVELRRPER